MRSAALLLFIAVAAGCGAPAHPPLLLISVDTLRPDHMSLFGYERRTTPELERWFAAGRIYSRAYASEASTSPSVVSMLTGLHPQRHGVRLHYQSLEAPVTTLPELLRGAGYRSAAVVSNYVLRDEALGLASRFDHYDEDMTEQEAGWNVRERRAVDTTDAAITWLDTQAGERGPHFLWVHYIDPHGPYAPPADAPADFTHPEPLRVDPERIHAAQRVAGAGDDGLEYVDRYDEEIAYVDREIGRLLEAYAARGYAERAVILFTADHGETMMEFDMWFRHGYHVHEPVIRIPMALRAPGLTPGREDELVSLVDVAPTLLTLAGVPVPADLDGRSLLDGRAPGVVFSEALGSGVQWRAAIARDEKWVVAIRRDGSFAERRHFALADEAYPDAQGAWTPGPVVDALVERIRLDPDPGGVPRRRAPDADAPNVAPGLDAETLRRLEALGYVDPAPDGP